MTAVSEARHSSAILPERFLIFDFSNLEDVGRFSFSNLLTKFGDHICMQIESDGFRKARRHIVNSPRCVMANVQTRGPVIFFFKYPYIRWHKSIHICRNVFVLNLRLSVIFDAFNMLMILLSIWKMLFKKFTKDKRELDLICRWSYDHYIYIIMQTINLYKYWTSIINR